MEGMWARGGGDLDAWQRGHECSWRGREPVAEGKLAEKMRTSEDGTRTCGRGTLVKGTRTRDRGEVEGWRRGCGGGVGIACGGDTDTRGREHGGRGGSLSYFSSW